MKKNKVKCDLAAEKQELRQGVKVSSGQQERRAGKIGKETWNKWVLKAVLGLHVVESLKLCLILLQPMDSSLPGSSVHGISQARILEWAAISFCSKSSQPMSPAMAGGFFTTEPPRKPFELNKSPRSQRLDTEA